MKPGYKQTTAGIVPEDWEVSTVGEEFDIKLGKMLDAEKNIGVPKPYLGNVAVQWGEIDTVNLSTMRISRDEMRRFRLQPGDLLVCEGGEVGRAAIWGAQLDECYYQKALHRLRPKNEFDPRLMAAFLRLWSEQGELLNHVTQTSIAHLPREKFVLVPLPVPPPSEQRAIAEALSDVDGLIGALDQLIAKKRDLKQAAMQQLLNDFSNTRRRPEILGNLFDGRPTMRNGSGSDPVTFLGMDDLSENGMVIRQATLPMREVKKGLTCFERDDVLVAKITPCFENGKGAFLGTLQTKKGFGSTEFHVLRAKPNADPRYLYYQTRMPEFRRRLESEMIGTAGQKRVPIKAIINYAIPIVHSYAEQTAIATVLSDMDAELAALESRRDKTRALKQGMMQQLLTGQIRLPV